METQEGQRRNRQPKFRRTTTPEWIAYLRLRGIAECDARVSKALRLRFLSPYQAAGVFYMTRGWYATVGFSGEIHWQRKSRSETGALAEYTSLLDELGKI